MSAPLRRRPMQAFALALLVELAVLASAGALLANAAPLKRTLSEPVPIVLLSEEAVPQPPPPEPLPPPPKPVRQAQIKPMPPPPPLVTPIAPAPVPVTQVPSAFTEPAPVPPPPPPPATAGVKADPGAEYAAKVRAAVQTAVSYPPAAYALHFSGRVRVEFHLRDGVPGDTQVVVSSGIGIIDRAALQSVQSAHYPDPPAEMRGNDHAYQVWVEFNR